jgi:hypothetical protein
MYGVLTTTGAALENLAGTRELTNKFADGARILVLTSIVYAFLSLLNLS